MPLDAFLARAMARLRLRDALRCAAAGTMAAAVTVLIARLASAVPWMRTVTGVVAFIAAAAAVEAALRRARNSRVAAAAIERRVGSLRNVLITAEQLLHRPDVASASMRTRVLDDAARRVAPIDLGRTLPIGREIAALIGATAVLAILASVRLPARTAAPLDRQTARTAVPSDAGFTVEIAPPSYTARPHLRLADPSTLDVLSGSQAIVRVGRAGETRVRLNGQPLAVSPDGSVAFTFVESGFLAVAGNGLDRLVPVTVVPDRAPEVRITAPGKDLRVATTAASIPIAADASDDLGLHTLELRYTIVSGTGEQFSFTEGTLPAALVRASDLKWHLDASLSLQALKLEPGDALIYRAVAADRRPGDAGSASSDTFFVEVAGPGDVPLEGVEMPPDRERYALSEAMIVLKIERLQAKERSLSRDGLVDAAANIAAEQRAVRANFVFMLGGEVEDEEVEAEASHEISEGRFANQARREIVNATVLMGRVEKALSAVSTHDALPLAREAVKALQRAFGHSRYLLRALPSRARIDPARRGSGDISSALDWTRALAPAAPDALADTARHALSELAGVTAGLSGRLPRTESVQRITRLAETLLAAGHADLQTAARSALAARADLEAGRIDDARAQLARAAAPLLTHAQRGRIDAAPASPGPGSHVAARLAGAAAIAGRERRP